MLVLEMRPGLVSSGAFEPLQDFSEDALAFLQRFVLHTARAPSMRRAVTGFPTTTTA